VNEWQATRRIRTVLRSLRWGGTGDPVFGRDSVHVTLAPVEEHLADLVMPCAFVRGGSATADPERPGLVTQEMMVTVVTAVAGDKVGERPLIGANRTGKTAWGGRGLTEIQVEMLAGIKMIGPGGQFGISFKASSRLAALAGNSKYHVWRDYGFEAMLTTAYDHMEPREVAAANAAGTVTISWLAPDDATKLVGYVVRRASGTILVAFPKDGTAVAWVSGLSTTDAPGAGTYTYSVFASYDDEGGSVEMDHSDCGSVTITF